MILDLEVWSAFISRSQAKSCFNFSVLSFYSLNIAVVPLISVCIWLMFFLFSAFRLLSIVYQSYLATSYCFSDWFYLITGLRANALETNYCLIFLSYSYFREHYSLSQLRRWKLYGVFSADRQSRMLLWASIQRRSSMSCCFLTISFLRDQQTDRRRSMQVFSSLSKAKTFLVQMSTSFQWLLIDLREFSSWFLSIEYILFIISISPTDLTIVLLQNQLNIAELKLFLTSQTAELIHSPTNLSAFANSRQICGRNGLWGIRDWMLFIWVQKHTDKKILIVIIVDIKNRIIS